MHSATRHRPHDVESNAWEMPLCHFKNICAQTRSAHDRRLDHIPWKVSEKLITYAFIANDYVHDLRTVDPGIANAFESCMFTKYPKNMTMSAVNLETYDGEVEWIKGNTFGFRKSEAQNHPGTWGRIWSSLTATGIYGADSFLEKGITAETMFDQVQLFESKIDMNSYSALMMEETLRLLQRTLADREKRQNPLQPAPWYSLQRSPVPLPNPVPTFRDERYHYGEEKKLICYENVFTVPESYDYFRSKDAAARYRSQALERVMLPSVRRRSCNREDLKVVYLKRPDRRVWNEVDVLSTLRRMGFSKIDTEIIDESTSAGEQIKIFYHADVLLSVHGSQLQSQYYMQPGSALVEMFPKNYVHWNQAALAQHTGVDHIELMKNTFPPEELVKSQAPELLPLLTTNVQNGLKWKNAVECSRAMPCYQNARSMGTHVNLEELENRLAEVALRLENSKDCIS